MTDVVSKPLLAISSESTRYLSGMLARRGRFGEARPCRNQEHIVLGEVQGGTGDRQVGKRDSLCEERLPRPEGGAPGKSGTDAGAASGWLALASFWTWRTAAGLTQTRGVGGGGGGRWRAVPQRPKPAKRRLGLLTETEAPPPPLHLDQHRWGIFA